MDRADADHQACAELIAGFPEPLLVPAPVIVELDWLATSRLGPEPFATFLGDLVSRDYTRVRELLDRYTDLRLGFVDASIVAIGERLQEPKLATLDHRHFSAIRPRHVDAFELLPT
jgi:predicted nucleic acid-binding protein